MKTQNIKDLEATVKELRCNLAKVLGKNKKISDEIKILHKEGSRYRQRIKGLLLSREKICDKSRLKSSKIKRLENKLKPKRHHFTGLMMQLAVMLRVFTSSSYKNISMILTLLKAYLPLDDLSVPCANTIQNWTSKLGLNALKNIDKTYLGEDICVIVDESIQIGSSILLARC